jgi:rhodanese-related sulfurtransferase
MAEDQARFSLIDVRGKHHFNEGHIPGAISSPAGTMEKSGLRCAQDPDTILVFYCEGPQCDQSHVALRAARLRGCMNTKVYNDGVRGWSAANEPLSVTQAHIHAVRDAVRKGRIFLIDTRPRERYAAGHIPGAISVPLEEMRREDFIGPSWEPRVIFYGEDRMDERAEKAARLAIQWGYHLEGTSNAPVGMLAGGIGQWRSEGGAVERGKGSESLVPPPQAGEIDFTEFQRLWSDAGKDVLFLDVRPGSTSNVSWVLTISYEELPFALKRLPKDREIIAFCSAGYRAMIAYHILAKNGFPVRFLKRDLTILPDGTVQ